MSAILPLEATDLDEAYLLETLCYEIHWSKKIFFAAQGKNYHNLKIVNGERIIGFCICQIITDEASLFNIAIHPDFQKQKFGQKLLLKLISDLSTIKTAKPITTLWLEVRVSNHAAIKLYQAVGFNQITIRRKYYDTTDGKGEDAIIMAYSLAL